MEKNCRNAFCAIWDLIFDNDKPSVVELDRAPSIATWISTIPETAMEA